MSRIYVKICGLTKPRDAAAAAAAGADAVGLVFAEGSPRQVDFATARAIVAATPPLLKIVGLFVDADAGQVAKTLREVPLDALQFHGRESGADCLRHERPYIKAVAMGGGEVDWKALLAEHAKARGLLLDAHRPGERGGGGEPFDWARTPSFEPPSPQLILAGGLDAANVAAAIRGSGARAVDVSSGVETRPGEKDAARMRDFVAAAKGALS